MCASRLDEIRQNIREQIKDETDKTLTQLGAKDASVLSSSRSLKSESPPQAFRSRFANVSDSSSSLSHSSHKVLPRTQCKALCIGMNQYQFLNPLENATRDAQDMASVMNHLGYEVTSIFDRDSLQTKSYLHRFLASIEEGDDVVLTFAGHGASFNSEAHLFPIDACRREDAINLYAEFIDQLKVTGAKSAVIIIDACRNQERIDIDDSNTSNQENWEVLDDWFEQFNLPPKQDLSKKVMDRSNAPTFGHAIIYSASHDKSASDGGDDVQNGLFTHFFKTEILNPSLSLTEIFENVRENMRIASSGAQSPAFHDDLTARYYFFPQITRYVSS